MTPNANRWYPPPLYRDDLGRTRGDCFLFIHELTHCWQHQYGTPVMIRGAFERTSDYGELRPDAMFRKFNIEQQASIVADHVRLKQAARPIHGGGSLADYQAVIPFLPR